MPAQIAHSCAFLTASMPGNSVSLPRVSRYLSTFAAMVAFLVCVLVGSGCESVSKQLTTFSEQVTRQYSPTSELLAHNRAIESEHRDAAEAGNIEAMYQLGLAIRDHWSPFYHTEYGRGGRASRRYLRYRGRELEDRSVRRFHTDAETVRRDDAESIQWLRRAAESGHIDAAFELGRSYALGRDGVIRTGSREMTRTRGVHPLLDLRHVHSELNLDEAIEWFRVVAESKGDPATIDTEAIHRSIHRQDIFDDKRYGIHRGDFASEDEYNETVERLMRERVEAARVTATDRVRRPALEALRSIYESGEANVTHEMAEALIDRYREAAERKRSWAIGVLAHFYRAGLGPIAPDAAASARLREEMAERDRRRQQEQWVGGGGIGGGDRPAGGASPTRLRVTGSSERDVWTAPHGSIAGKVDPGSILHVVQATSVGSNTWYQVQLVSGRMSTTDHMYGRERRPLSSGWVVESAVVPHH